MWRIGLAVVVGGIVLKKFKPAFGIRGIRNHNAGNIRLNDAFKWDGQVEGSDKSFCTFVSAEWGVRALAKTLMNYGRVHGLNTVSEIISRWAPSVENDTDAYIESVADAIGWYSWVPLDLDNMSTVTDLVKAIIHHENGVQPYSDELIETGVCMAGESFA